MKVVEGRGRALCLALVLVAAVPGCGSVLFAPYQEIRPVCANVPSAGFSAPAVGAGCRSGQVMRLDRREDHVLEARADGYEPLTVRLESEVSVFRAAVSIVLNGLISTPTLWIATPFLCAIDIKAGAWQVLEPGEVVVELAGAGGASPASAASWPATNPTPSAYCSSCGARVGGSSYCTSCGARAR